MKLAIMQPYFFPYIGYFSLMEYADEFILFDTPQYDRKGWMNRNRILKPKEGWQYLRAGVIKPPFRAAIREVQISPDSDWKEAISRQLEHYKETAPHYNDALDLITSSLAEPAATLTEVNRNTLTAVRDYLAIQCPIRIFSEMDLELREVEHAGQWALRISEACNAAEYVNPPGGKDIFDPQDFSQLGIGLSFLTSRLTEYNQHRDAFEEGLSIIDALMFCSKEEIRAMVCDFTLEKA